MKPPMILRFAFLLVLLSPASRADELQELVDSLPVVWKRALDETRELRAGNRPEMMDAADMIRERLLPHLVRLESSLRGEPEKETRKLIERDLEAVARNALFKGHSQGWGGTAVSLDQVTAQADHLLHRISYFVWRYSEKHKDFDWEGWQDRWAAAEEPEEVGEGSAVEPE